MSTSASWPAKKSKSGRSAARTPCRSRSIRTPGSSTRARGTCRASRSSRRRNHRSLGANSTGVTSRNPAIKPGDVLGHFVAINPLTGEKKWEVPLTDLPSSAGMLATGGGLVFTGKLTGEFVALDEETGKTLWQFKTGSSINSTAITYTHNGRQYVTIASGLGGGLARRFAADKVPTGGSVWTFALMPDK